MAQHRVDIAIGVQAQLGQMVRTQRELLELNRRLVRTTESSLELRRASSGLPGAFQMGAGIVSVGALLGVVRRLHGEMRAVLATGVAFNQRLETSRIGLAGILRQFNPDRYADFTAAMGASAAAVDLLAEKARKSPATFEALVGAFQGTAGAMSAAGMSIREQVDLITLMSQTLSGLGIRSEQILQESRALVTGNITEDAMAARILGITAAQVKQAREQGRLYDFLADQMTGFAEAADAGAASLETLKSNLQDAFQQQTARETEELTEALKRLYGALGEFVGSEQFGDFVRMLADGAQSGVQALTDLTGWVQRNTHWLKALGVTALYAAGALAAIRLGRLLAPATVGAQALGQLLAEGIRTGTLRGLSGVGRAAGGLLRPEFTALGKTLGSTMGLTLGVEFTGMMMVALANAVADAQRASIETANAIEAPLHAMRRQAIGAQSEEELAQVRRSAEAMAARLRADAAALGGDDRRSPVAARREAEQLREQAVAYERIAAAIERRGEAIVADNRALAQAAAAEERRLETLKAWRELASGRDEAQARLAQAQRDALEGAEREAALQARLAALDAERGQVLARNLADAGQTGEQLSVAVAAQDRELADLARERLGVERELAQVQAELEREAAERRERMTQLNLEQVRLEEEAVRQSYEAQGGDARAHFAELEALAVRRWELELSGLQAAADAAESPAAREATALELANAERERAIELKGLELERDRELEQQARAAYTAELERIRGLVQAADEALLSPQDIEQRTALEARRAELVERAEAAFARYRETVEGMGLPEAGLAGGPGLGEAPGPQSRMERTEGAFGELGSPQNSYQGGVEALLGGLMEAQMQMGTLWNNMAQGIQSVAGAVQQSLSGAIEGLMNRTMSWGDALRSVAQSFGASMLKAIADIAAQWAVKQALMLVQHVATKGKMFAVDAAYAAKGLALSLANAAKSLVAWIPSAIAASISSWGVAAALGAAAVAALLLFADGGYTGGSQRTKPAGVVHEGEWVAPMWQVRHPVYGPMIARLEAARMGRGLDTNVQYPGARPGAYAVGGPVAMPLPNTGGRGADGVRPPENRFNIGVFNDPSALRRWAESQEGQVAILDVMRRHRHEFMG